MQETTKLSEALSEAAEWRLIGMLFECPTEGWFEAVTTLADEVADPNLKKAAAAANVAEEGLYHAIFGPGGPCPPREVSYRSWVQPGYLLSELATFYDAFAYKPASPEVPDHVSVEAGFIGYLHMKEAYAVERGAHVQAAITSKAIESFIAQHLVKMADSFTETLAYSEFDYLTLAGQALLERVGLDPDKVRTRELPILAEVETDSFACGDTANEAEMSDV